MLNILYDIIIPEHSIIIYCDYMIITVTVTYDLHNTLYNRFVTVVTVTLC